LAVSKGIIEKHGGMIEAESRPGEGAAFTVHLPIVPIPADTEHRPVIPEGGDAEGAGAS